MNPIEYDRTFRGFYCWSDIQFDDIGLLLDIALDEVDPSCGLSGVFGRHDELMLDLHGCIDAQGVTG